MRQPGLCVRAMAGRQADGVDRHLQSSGPTEWSSVGLVIAPAEAAWLVGSRAIGAVDGVRTTRPDQAQVSRVALGCMSYGARGYHQWTPDKEESLPLFRRAVELGVTFWDTACQRFRRGQLEGVRRSRLANLHARSPCSATTAARPSSMPPLSLLFPRQSLPPSTRAIPATSRPASVRL